MKKILVATTALIGAMTIANAASAAEAPALKLGMDMRFWAFMIDDDSQGLEDKDFRVDVRLPITVTGKTDNGLTWGGYVRLRTSADNGFSNALPQSAATRTGMFHDYGFVHIGGDFGKIELGDNDGPLTVTYVAAPLTGALQINAAGNGIPTAFSNRGALPAGAPTLGNFNYGSALYLDQSSRINYYTPVFAGFQGAIGYAPELGSRGLNVATGQSAGVPYSSIEDAFEAAIVWNGKFDPVTVKASIGYAGGEANNRAGAAAINDLDLWQAGVQVGFGPFTVGGAYFDNNDSRSVLHDDETGWNVGGSWKQGALTVVAVYGQVDTELVAGGVETTDSMYGLGVNYVLTPGLHLDADVMFFDLEAPAATPIGAPAGSGNEGTAFIARTRILL